MQCKKPKLTLWLIGLLIILIGLTQFISPKETVVNQEKNLEIDYSQADKPTNQEEDKNKEQVEDKPQESKLDSNMAYYSKEDVANYLIEFGHLPKNYLTKNEAMDLGWVASKGNLWDVTDKGVIGGDRFGNREGKLPTAKGRKYFEADVNYKGGRRGAERLVFSNDGLIFYTRDHYKTFEEIKGR